MILICFVEMDRKELVVRPGPFISSSAKSEGAGLVVAAIGWISPHCTSGLRIRRT